MTQRALKLILAPALLFAFAAMNGQTPASSTPANQQTQTSSGSPSSLNTDAGQTSDLASLIKALSGRWSLQVKFEPSREMPKGLSTTGEETWRGAIGGLTLLEEERISTPAGDLSLLGVIWWDAKLARHGVQQPAPLHM